MWIETLYQQDEVNTYLASHTCITYSTLYAKFIPLFSSIQLANPTAIQALLLIFPLNTFCVYYNMEVLYTYFLPTQRALTSCVYYNMEVLYIYFLPTQRALTSCVYYNMEILYTYFLPTQRAFTSCVYYNMERGNTYPASTSVDTLPGTIFRISQPKSTHSLSTANST